MEGHEFREGLWDVLAPVAFWVNKPSAAQRTENKIIQHRAAIESGLELPDTIYSNDPVEIRSFIRRHGGKIVYKCLAPGAWTSGDKIFGAYTAVLDEDKLVDDDLLIATPGIYQAMVPKAFEVRATFMGRSCFAAKIRSQQTTSGKTDWRRAYHELEMEPTVLPDSLIRICQGLMKKLGIVFGCFDFIVTPDNRYIFLEVNQMGQFLFVEQYTKLPLLDAFTDYLLHGNFDFEYDGASVNVRFDDVAAVVEERMTEAAKTHYIPPEHAVKE